MSGGPKTTTIPHHHLKPSHFKSGGFERGRKLFAVSEGGVVEILKPAQENVEKVRVGARVPRRARARPGLRAHPRQSEGEPRMQRVEMGQQDRRDKEKQEKAKKMWRN